MLQIKSKEILFLCFFGLVLLLIFLFTFYRNNRLSNDGRFIVGIIAKEESSKSGQVYSVSYFYKSGRFDITFSGVGLKLNKGELVFLKISSSNPKIFDVLNFIDIKVPACIKITDVPYGGWEKIPIDTCN